jgi:hypothetical protein
MMSSMCVTAWSWPITRRRTKSPPDAIFGRSILPLIVRHADLVPAHGIGDRRCRQRFGATERDDRIQVHQQQAFGLVDQVLLGTRQYLSTGFPGAWQTAYERRRHRTPRDSIRLRYRDMA